MVQNTGHKSDLLICKCWPSFVPFSHLKKKPIKYPFDKYCQFIAICYSAWVIVMLFGFQCTLWCAFLWSLRWRKNKCNIKVVNTAIKTMSHSCLLLLGKLTKDGVQFKVDYSIMGLLHGCPMHCAFEPFSRTMTVLIAITFHHCLDTLCHFSPHS